jgi:hypothetical protein
VRETLINALLRCHLMQHQCSLLKPPSIFQDRLGTSIGKVDLKKSERVSAGIVHSRRRFEKRHIFFEFSLYLSRACLGKMIVFVYKWLQKCRFSQETLADDEVMKADRRGSKMLAIDRLYIKVHTTISISRYYI